MRSGNVRLTTWKCEETLRAIQGTLGNSTSMEEPEGLSDKLTNDQHRWDSPKPPCVGFRFWDVLET